LLLQHYAFNWAAPLASEQTVIDDFPIKHSQPHFHESSRTQARSAELTDLPPSSAACKLTTYIFFT
jgi:hypothetical protein